MTIFELLHGMKGFAEEAVRDMALPCKPTRDGTAGERPPEVHLQRLPDSKSPDKIAPYVLIQAIKWRYVQEEGKRDKAFVTLRLIGCVYGENEEEGSLRLVNLFDRLNFCLLRGCVVAKKFRLDKKTELEGIFYPEDTAPFYAGEMIGDFEMAPIVRELDLSGAATVSGSFEIGDALGD